MAEREVEVISTADGRLSLRLLGDQCTGCEGGCAGRCNLFATTAAGEFVLEGAGLPGAVAGSRYRLALDDQALRRAAWLGYGRALLGLLLGAFAGYAAGAAWPAARDGLTLAGLLAGTFLAVLVSKRHLPAPRLLPAAVATPDPCKSDCP
ncbi:SoxR reducing system RseC family protein [Arenimonas sp.]|uniref:SoxR reducing system RseC family protein n=1 Tax=Arenimonas sp. TaxID=1872635 RepID=UPI0025BC3751|nr:SoxR reducing system RseC family protein [Arenimonas sp.]